MSAGPRVIVLIRKLPEVSAEQFRNHYETVHAPLIDRLLPFYSAYRRNYAEAPAREGSAPPPYDVVTELEFASEADYDAWRETLAKPEIVAQIRADEQNFLDGGETRMFRVRSHASSYAPVTA